MKVFRLARKKYKIELSGAGAAKSGNRWNSKGTEMIYCSDSRALAMAEVAVHLPLGLLPHDFVMMEIEIPSIVKSKTIAIAKLPPGWNDFPPVTATQKIGDDFIHAGLVCVLKVPSAVVKGDFNYLINTAHQDFKKIKIRSQSEFPFDRRLLK